MGRVHIWRSTGQGHGHRSQKVENSSSRNVKLRSAITPVLSNIELWCLGATWGFQVWQIEWCDRHLCEVNMRNEMHTFTGGPSIRRQSCYLVIWWILCSNVTCEWCSGDVSHTQLDGHGKWSFNITGSCYVLLAVITCRRVTKWKTREQSARQFTPTHCDLASSW